MNDAAVNEHTRQQPPPLAGERQWSEIRAPVNQLWHRRVDHRDPCQRHPDEHRDVDPEDRVRNQRTGLTTHPGRVHHRLRAVFLYFTTLRRFVLDTPLAKTL